LILSESSIHSSILPLNSAGEPMKYGSAMHIQSLYSEYSRCHLREGVSRPSARHSRFQLGWLGHNFIPKPSLLLLLTLTYSLLLSSIYSPILSLHRTSYRTQEGKKRKRSCPRDFLYE
jgi:hypothetical protein